MEAKQGGLLLKRKDFLGVDEEAGSHPNRTYYFKKNADDLNEIILTCTKTLQNNRQDKDSLLLRGTTYMKMDRFREAVDDFTSLLNMASPSVETFYKRGMAYAKLSLHEAAIADFSHVLNAIPEHVNASFARAACFNTIGQFSRAIEDYNTALLQDQSVNNGAAEGMGDRTSHGAGQNSASRSINSRSDHRNNSRPSRSNATPLQRSSRDSSSPMAVTVNSNNSSRNRSGNQAGPRSGHGHGDGNDYSSTRVSSRQSANAMRSASPVKPRHMNRPESEDTFLDHTNREIDTSMEVEADDNSTVISGITFMSNQPSHTHTPRDRDRDRGEYMDSHHSPVPAGLPLSSDEYHQKGFEFRRQGNFQAAVEEYSKALQKDPNHFKALFNRAFAMDKLGQFGLAVRDYGRAIEIDPNNAYAFYNRGISYDRHKDYVAACLDFRRATQLSPTNLDFLHNLALCLRKMGKTKEALESYTKCLKFDPGHVKARQGRAMCYETLQQYHEALQDYDVIVKKNPQHMMCVVSRAHLLHRMSELQQEEKHSLAMNTSTGGHSTPPHSNYSDEAFLSFSSALNVLCPNVQTLIHSITTPSSTGSTSHMSLHSYNSTTSSNGQINRCTESISILYARAKILEERGDNEGSIRDLTMSIELATALVKVQDNKFLIAKSGMNTNSSAIQLHNSRGSSDRSFERDAHKLQNSCHSLYLLFYNRALHWKTCGQYENAVSDLSTSQQLITDEIRDLQQSTHQKKDEQVIDRIQTLTTALNNAYNHRGFCYRKLSNYQAAIDDYTAAIKVIPQNARALNNRAYCLAKLEMFNEAVEDYSEVIALDPLNSHSYHNRGISLDRLGRAADALADFNKVIELDSSATMPEKSESTPYQGGELVDLSSSFRERYATGNDTPAQMTTQENALSTHSNSDQAVSCIGHIVSSGCNTRDDGAARVRKPRRAPPSRPNKAPPPSPLDALASSFARQSQKEHQIREQNTSSPRVSRSSPNRQEISQSFDSIRLSPRGGKSPMKHRTVPHSAMGRDLSKHRDDARLASPSVSVENSYNTRSFVDRTQHRRY